MVTKDPVTVKNEENGEDASPSLHAKVAPTLALNPPINSPMTWSGIGNAAPLHTGLYPHTRCHR